MPKPDGPHYLRTNLQTRLPRRHVFFDTEATVTYSGGVQLQEWRCGVARFRDADTRRPKPRTYETDYLSPEDLWRDISDFTRQGCRTILWAHNLAYDLRISRAFVVLPALGWSLRAIVLDGMACWARFQRGKASLVCTDLSSWVPVPLARISSDVNIPRYPLPTDASDLAGLLKRCRGDVAVLACAVLEILDWIEREDLGNWQITGSAQAWSCFRHRFLTHNLLVHNDARVRETERRAIWAGRTETWRHGKYNGGGFAEFDLETAYARIAKEVTLPVQYVGSLARMARRDFDEWRRTRCLLSECIVTTDRPVVPAAHDDRIVWPVGNFRTVLWDNEAASAIRAGAKVRFYRTAVYTRAPLLHEWATWILDALSKPSGEVSRLQRRVLKAWSRSLIGRFSLRYRSWAPMGTSSTADLFLSKLVGKRETTAAAIMQVGRDLLELGALEDHENALPQITGYITAECRVRMLDLIDTAGEQNVYYMDTDSLIVNGAGARRLRLRIARDGAYGLREKAAISRLELSGPRNLTVDEQPRIAGVPRRAERLSQDHYFGSVWQGLGEALATGTPDRVVIHERAFHITATDHRREWIDNGRTRPYRLDVPVPPRRGHARKVAQ